MVQEKSIAVKEMVDAFSLEVLAGEENLNNKVTKSYTRRPGLEFIKFLDFFPMEHVHVLGQNEIQYLTSLPDEERSNRVQNLIKYKPPAIIVTDGQEDLKYLIILIHVCK